ncbi:hypothetical protein R3P38DRAFT_3485199 [Favolaschia claudopus]|uniref:Uncharacterized protein n=1 Tax=Favolaschia claudopus TaxID=2862362 RepID=A0AAW0CBE0_9AGAR
MPSSASATSSSFPLFPSNCAGPPGILTPGFFRGCVIEEPNTFLRTCCDSVGSAATVAKGVCGCPYNANFTTENFQPFLDCAEMYNKSSVCAGPPLKDSDKGAVFDLRPRWYMVVGVLGMALVSGAVGM